MLDRGSLGQIRARRSSVFGESPQSPVPRTRLVTARGEGESRKVGAGNPVSGRWRRRGERAGIAGISFTALRRGSAPSRRVAGDSEDGHQETSPISGAAPLSRVLGRTRRRLIGEIVAETPRKGRGARTVGTGDSGGLGRGRKGPLGIRRGVLQVNLRQKGPTRAKDLSPLGPPLAGAVGAISISGALFTGRAPESRALGRPLGLPFHAGTLWFIPIGPDDQVIRGTQAPRGTSLIGDGVSQVFATGILRGRT